MTEILLDAGSLSDRYNGLYESSYSAVNMQTKMQDIPWIWNFNRKEKRL